MNTSSIATIVLLVSSIFWGLLWIPLKSLSSMGIEGILLTCIAYGVMFLVLLPFVINKIYRYRLHFLPLLGIFFAGGLANLCFNYAMVYGDVVRVMILFYLLPVWGVLGGRFILKEPTGLLRWLGVVLAVTGAFIILGGAQIFSQPPSWIDLVALLSGFFFAVNIMLFRAVEKIPLLVKLESLFLGCFALSGALLLIGVETLSAGISIEVIGWTVVFALVWLFWINLGSQWAVTKMPAGRSTILIIMELIAAVLSAIWVGGEAITAHVIVGGVLVLSATMIEVVDNNDSE